MLTAMNQEGVQVLARDVSKGNPYQCPACEASVILRKGTVKVHHFAHTEGFVCAYGKGESDEHHAAKLGLYDALAIHPLIKAVKIEHPMFGGLMRPDLAFRTTSDKICAIEFQRSIISDTEITRRTVQYTERNIPVLWLAFGLKERYAESKEVRLSEWQHWVQVMNYGRLYEWSHSTLIARYKLSKIYREGSSWWEGSGEDAQEVSSEGRTLKRTRSLAFAGNFDVVKEMGSFVKDKFHKYPRALLWGKND